MAPVAMNNEHPARAVATVVGVLAISATGCLAEDQSTGTSVEHVTVAPGLYTYLDEGESFPIVDVAATASVAYLARMHRGVQLVDLETMQLGERWSHDDQEEQLVVDGLQVAGDQLIVWGQRHDPDPYDSRYSRPFVIKALALDKPDVLWSVTLELAAAIDSGSVYVQLPNTDAFVDEATSTLWVSFGHIHHPDRVVAFPLPVESHASYDFLDLPGAQEVAVDNPKSVFVDADGGAYVASGDAGVFRIAAESDQPQRVASDVGYAVDARVRDGIAYVADHDGALHRVAVATGASLGTASIDDWVEGIEITADVVLVATRTGVFAAPVAVQ